MTHFNNFTDSKHIFNSLDQQVHDLNQASILLTGAAGFLGYQFLHFFLYLEENYGFKFKRVTAIDNYIRGVPDWLKKVEARFTALEIINADVLLFEPENEYDFIIHAASIASPTFYRKYPLETIRVNVNGTDRLLDFSTRQSVKPKSFLFFSSSEIYGDPAPSNIPTPETYLGNVSSYGPRACYDESKRVGETLCYNYFHKYDIPVKIVRPFNNYGPGLSISDRRVIPDMFHSLISENAITLLSDGKATRTFCYVADAVAGYLKALLSPCHGEIFNIGSDSPEVSIYDLAEIIKNTLGNASTKINLATSADKHYLTDNPSRRCPDLSKARELLGYNPTTTLEKGLELTYNYYQSVLNVKTSG